MNSRKNTLIEIERLLIEINGTNVVLPKAGRNRKLLKKSPASSVMIYIPRLLLFVWSLSLIVTTIILIVRT